MWSKLIDKKYKNNFVNDLFDANNIENINTKNTVMSGNTFRTNENKY